MHQAQAIRDAVVAVLMNRTAAADRVFGGRVRVLRSGELPAISVFTWEESVDPESRNTAPRELSRTAQFSIEAVIRLTERYDNDLFDLRQDIERAMHADPTFSGTASDSLLLTTTIDVDVSTSLQVASALITYAVHYFTQAPDATDVPLADFATADIKTRLGGTADAVEDVVTLPTGST